MVKVSLCEFKRLTKSAFELVTARTKAQGFSSVSELFTTETGRKVREEILEQPSFIPIELQYTDWGNIFIAEFSMDMLNDIGTNWCTGNDKYLIDKMFDACVHNEVFTVKATDENNGIRVYCIVISDVKDVKGNLSYILESLKIGKFKDSLLYVEGE